jgi:hypothetical protein
MTRAGREAGATEEEAAGSTCRLVSLPTTPANQKK